MKIVFNTGDANYSLLVEGDSATSKKRFNDKDEVEFFYVSTYLNPKVEHYRDYRVIYCSDGQTIKDAIYFS